MLTIFKITSQIIMLINGILRSISVFLKIFLISLWLRKLLNNCGGWVIMQESSQTQNTTYIHNHIRVSLSFIRFIHFCLHVMYLNHISKEIKFLHF